MAETVEQAARDVAKCLNERDGQGLDLRHVAMLVNHAQQPVQETLSDEQKAVLNFLLGASDLDGAWFGEQPTKENGSFWWRDKLRKAFQADRAITKGTT